MKSGSEDGEIAHIYERMLQGDKAALTQLQQVENKFSPLRKSTKKTIDGPKETSTKNDNVLVKGQKSENLKKNLQ